MTNADPLPATVLSRKAIVYVRQSTQTQVQIHRESQRRLYDLVEEARRRSFRDVEVIDDDPGRSAAEPWHARASRDSSPASAPARSAPFFVSMRPVSPVTVGTGTISSNYAALSVPVSSIPMVSTTDAGPTIAYN
jgi:hypothetical protein